MIKGKPINPEQDAKLQELATTHEKNMNEMIDNLRRFGSDACGMVGALMDVSGDDGSRLPPEVKKCVTLLALRAAAFRMLQDILEARVDETQKELIKIVADCNEEAVETALKSGQAGTDSLNELSRILGTEVNPTANNPVRG